MKWGDERAVITSRQLGWAWAVVTMALLVVAIFTLVSAL
jgi:type IV secretory pathway component VirB8